MKLTKRSTTEIQGTYGTTFLRVLGLDLTVDVGGDSAGDETAESTTEEEEDDAALSALAEPTDDRRFAVASPRG